MSGPPEQLLNEDKARFYRTLDGLESLSKTRGHFMVNSPKDHFHVLYDAMGCNISALALYLATDSNLLSSNELNEIAKRLGKLTTDLRAPGKENPKIEKHTEVLNNLDELLIGIFAELKRRLKADGKFEGPKETVAGCVEDWAEQKEKIYEHCDMLKEKLDDLILVALEKIKKGQVD